ncbi:MULTISPECIES: hypothetical protein [Trichocoleus]|uniref:Uncharacterized protein n=1 Tax=Trichocoleus desertorum GB2-A4 TaxID=2933944 RepID=A0ABV0JH69_9CYAN|nr:hypothetical protein [Trichocoleus sp. FACHB-46]MBD1862370.1 hypothetical protein [Trichocoleus sp. FACHB-46]
MSQLPQSGQLQVFQSLISSRRRYIQNLPIQPDRIGVPLVYPTIVDLREDGDESILTYPTVAAKRQPKRVLDLLRQQKVKSPFRLPDPRIKRSPNAPAEGWAAYHLPRSGELEVAYVGGDIPFQPLGTTAGWMLSPMIDDETCILGHWQYWKEIQEAGTLLNTSIPRIVFESKPHPKVMGMLHYCLDMITPAWRVNTQQKWNAVRYLIDWILWSLGHCSVPDFPTDLWDGGVHDRLFQVFDVSYLLLWPYDHLGALLEELSDESYRVPPQISMEVAEREVKSLFPYRNGDYRDQLLVDPETGTGRILMTASNYSFELLGLNTDALLSKVAIINLYLFAPWGVFPFEFLQHDLDSAELQACLGRTLSVVKRKQLNADYFSATEPALDGDRYQPIQLRQRRTTKSLADLGLNVKKAPQIMPTQRMEAPVLPGLPGGPPLPSPQDLPGLSLRSITPASGSKSSNSQNQNRLLPQGDDEQS